jgi:hypothetical protein
LIVLSSISYAAKVRIYSLNDSFVYWGSPNLNIGDKQNMDVHYDREVIIRLNTTALPANVNIVSAIFNSTVYNSYVDAGEYSYIGIYEVYKSPLYDWSEYNITWNTRPNSSSHFNQTPESGVNFTSSWLGDISCTVDWSCMYQWNVTKMTKKAYSNNQDLDLYFNVSNGYGIGSGDWVTVAIGREYGNFYFLEVEYYYNYPTVTLSKPANNSNLYYKDRPFRFNFSTDSGDAITNASLYGNWSGTWKLNQTNTSAVSKDSVVYNFNLLNLSRGYNYIWNVEVCDIDGNCTFATNNFTFNVLNTIPAITASITPSPAQATDNLTGTIAYTDLDGDANTINQTLWYNGTVIVSTATNTTFLGSGNLSVGENWIFSARSFDGSEWSSWVNSSTINIGDTTPPIITNSNVTNKSTTIPLNTKVNITAICTDTASSIDWVKFSYASPSSNLTNVSTGNHSGDTYYYEMTLNEKGNWTFNMTWCKDSSGNMDNDTYNYWVYIDDTAPSIINITVDSTIYTDETQNITINCTDLYSPVSSAIVTINSSGILTNYSMSQSGDLWFYATTYGAGTYSTTSFYCQDSSNNLNITESVNSFTSSTRPTTGGDTPAGGGGSSDTTTKRDCNVTIIPQNLTFYSEDYVLRVLINNKENTSFSMNYAISSSYFSLRGISTILYSNSQKEVSVLRSSNLTTNTTATLTLSSSECNNIVSTITFINIKKDSEALITIKELGEKIIEKVTSNINLFSLKIPFWMVFIIIIALISLLLFFANMNLTTKVFSGAVLIILLSIISTFIIPSSVLSVNEQEEFIINNTAAKVSESTSYFTAIFTYKIFEISSYNIPLGVLLLPLFIVIVSIFMLYSDFDWWAKILLSLIISIILLIILYYVIITWVK